MSSSPNPLACALFLICAFIARRTRALGVAAHRGCRGGCSCRSTAVCACAAAECSATTRRCADSSSMVPAAAASFALCFAVVDAARAVGSRTDSGRCPSSGYAALGAWAGLGFMLGELPNSFVKRQLDVAPGQAPRGRAARGRLVRRRSDRFDHRNADRAVARDADAVDDVGVRARRSAPEFISRSAFCCIDSA